MNTEEGIELMGNVKDGSSNLHSNAQGKEVSMRVWWRGKNGIDIS